MATQVTEPKGAVLFRRGEPAFGIFLVKRGRIDLRLEAEGGKALWNRIVTRDSIVGLPATLAGGRYSLTAITLEESQLAFVTAKDLTGLAKCDPGFGLELVRAVSDEVLQMRTMLASTMAVVAATPA